MSKEQRNIDFWEKVLEDLEPDYKSWFEQEKKYLGKNITKNSKVLEVGCGEGRSLKDILPITKNLTGIDNDQKAVDDAKKRFKNYPSVKIIKAEAKELPFKAEEFDFVICMTTFANFGKDKFKVLEEMKRTLKKNGRIIISVFNENAWETRSKVYKKVGAKIKELKKGRAVFEGGIVSEQFSKKELEDIFTQVDLKINDIIKLKIAYICNLSK